MRTICLLIVILFAEAISAGKIDLRGHNLLDPKSSTLDNERGPIEDLIRNMIETQLEMMPNTMTFTNNTEFSTATDSFSLYLLADRLEITNLKTIHCKQVTYNLFTGKLTVVMGAENLQASGAMMFTSTNTDPIWPELQIPSPLFGSGPCFAGLEHGIFEVSGTFNLLSMTLNKVDYKFDILKTNFAMERFMGTLESGDIMVQNVNDFGPTMIKAMDGQFHSDLAPILEIIINSFLAGSSKDV